MNKKILRTINQFADQMPLMIEVFPNTTLISGKQAIAEGHAFIEGKAIDPNKTYGRTHSFRLINHRKKMKKFYKKYGDNFLSFYMKWFKKHTEEMKDRYPEQFKSKADVPAT